MSSNYTRWGTLCGLRRLRGGGGADKNYALWISLWRHVTETERRSSAHGNMETDDVSRQVNWDSKWGITQFLVGRQFVVTLFVEIQVRENGDVCTWRWNGERRERERERERARGACRQTAVFTDIETQGSYWQMKTWFVLSIIQASFNIIIQSVHCACNCSFIPTVKKKKKMLVFVIHKQYMSCCTVCLVIVPLLFASALCNVIINCFYLF
jgi:hypothetical protein